MQIAFYLSVAFLGYAVGRISHIYGGHLKAPHHCIYGLILVIIGLFFYKDGIGWVFLCFGTGHFISDFKDFWQLKFFGTDEEDKRKFWGVD